MKKFQGYLTKLKIDKKNKLFIKQFSQEMINKNKLINEKAHNKFKNEIEAIKKINKIENKYVITPKIESINEKKLIIKQKYIQGCSFQNYLLKNCNIIYFNKRLNKLFYEFGKFLSEFHKRYMEKNQKRTQLHGDLNQKNLIITKDNNIFLFDPSNKKGEIYEDLCDFLLNLYILNPIANLIINKKKLYELKDKFLKGYKSNIDINKEKLKKEILKQIKKHIKSKLSNKIIYTIKKKIMDQISKKIYIKILRGEIKI